MGLRRHCPEQDCAEQEAATDPPCRDLPYPRFHPVPTQPVFSPRTPEIVAARPADGLERVPEQPAIEEDAPQKKVPKTPAAEQVPLPEPSKTSAGGSAQGSGPAGAGNASPPSWLFAERIPDALIEKAEPKATVKVDPNAKPGTELRR